MYHFYWLLHALSPFCFYNYALSLESLSFSSLFWAVSFCSASWREEVLVRTDDNKSLRLYVTTIPTEYRFHTFLEDPVYRISIATQNVAYNQPTQPGFYIGPELKGTFRGYTFK